MWLFERDKGLLQSSLAHSMEFLYKESDTVKKWTELIPYFPKDDLRLKMGKKVSKQSSI